MLLMVMLLIQRNEGCRYEREIAYCGSDCTGRPRCNGKTCGNVDDMCYCSCSQSYTCMTTELGYKWNNGVKLENGSYALNGTKGDGKQYNCS
jgi:hypothetical protein